MTSVVFFGSFALFLLLRVPIGISLGLSTIVTIMYSDSLPLQLVFKELLTAVDSFPIMAVPFFILAGEIMGKGGISDRIFKVANTLVGNKTGGFAIATIVTCMFFAAISGSGAATVAAIGGIMIPAMVKQGYDKNFAKACRRGSRFNRGYYPTKYSYGYLRSSWKCINWRYVHCWNCTRCFSRDWFNGMDIYLLPKERL